MKTKPLFIMGSARSGTTWLANILSSHPDISSPTCVEHHGIHESHLFDHTRYVFPDDIECNAFINEYKKEDLFKLLSIDPTTFCKNCASKHDVFYWFSALMDKFAKTNNTSYWLEKTPKHLIYYDEILKNFPDCKFVLIKRGFKQTILSNLTKYARADTSRARQIIEKSYRYELDLRAAKRLCKHSGNVVTIEYEHLAENNDKQIEKILKHLSLDVMQLKSNYEADSSYKTNTKKYIMKPRDWWLAYSIRLITRMVPYEVACRLRKSRDAKTKTTFPLFSRLD